METRTHQNSKRLPPRTLSFDDINRLVNFLQQYAEQHAILLPGRVPSHKRDDVKLLPSYLLTTSYTTGYLDAL